MRTDKFLGEVCDEMLKKMYLEADPPLDLSIPPTGEKPYCGDYFLVQERQDEIFDETAKKNKLTNKERKRIMFTIFNYAPKGYKEDLREQTKN